MTAYERIVDALRDAGSTTKDTGHGKTTAQCPAHDDSNPSLSVTAIEGQTLIYCHAGCQHDDILAALHLTPADLYDNPKGPEYPYSDGRRVHKTPTKQFRQTGNTKGKALYHIERIGEAATVAVVEGEKDVHAIESAGGVAVCSAMGAGKAHLFDWTPLQGKNVIVIADKDEPGRKHAQDVKTLLRGIAKTVRIFEAKAGKDAADHIAAGHTLKDFTPADNNGVNGHHPETPPDTPTISLEAIENHFWTARPELQLIYLAALNRMTSPWAVFACCAARILTLIPPTITLPPIIGGPGSLNWYAAITAKSGGGKGAASAVSSALIPADITIRGIGSGEGMIEAYQRAPIGKEPPPPVTSVLFSIDEIDSLGAMGGRTGQTTMSILRQGFSGETLGYSYRGRQAETVAAHTYRMTLLASVQPERAGILFDQTGGGTPQRFMWFPGRDRRITAHPPDWPNERSGRPKIIPAISPADIKRAPLVVPIPDHVADFIRVTRAASMNGDDVALDGHALFCREKLAYALAYMHGNLEITDDDWKLSGIAAAVSDWCRTKVAEAYQDSKDRTSRERGQAQALANDERNLVEQEVYLTHLARIERTVIKNLKTHGSMTPGALHRDLASRDRPRFDAAIADASARGDIILVDGRWQLG